MSILLFGELFWNLNCKTESYLLDESWNFEESDILDAVKPLHNSINLLKYSAYFVLFQQNKVLKKKITAESKKNSIYEGKVGLNNTM